MTVLHWRESPEYEDAKARALRELTHARDQIEKDQHLNAQSAMVEAMRQSQRCFGLIRHGEEIRPSEEAADA